LEIAREYHATIYDNPKRLPEYAKQIGFWKARGIYAIEQDSDEILMNPDQMLNRKLFFEKNPDVLCLMADKLIPVKKHGISNRYINYFGDPFSFLIYGLKGSRVKENKAYLSKSETWGNIYTYSEEDIIPIGDGGTTTVNIERAKEIFGEEFYSPQFAATNFNMLVEKTGSVGCIPEDNVLHYSNGRFVSYLSKLHFRVYTNLNCKEQSGYSSRARTCKKLQRRKILFVLYVLTIVGPVADSVRLSIFHKDGSLLLHFVYTYYVVFMIVVELFKKIFKIQGKEIRYGTS
jgi:hypothetical protein